MDTSLAVALEPEGVVGFGQLRRLGHDANSVRALVRSGALERVWRGVYASPAQGTSRSSVDRHLLRARAIARGLPAHALSHVTAVAMWGLPVVNGDLAMVHFSAIERGRARRHGDVWRHPAVPAPLTCALQGLRVVRPALAVAQTGALLGPRAGLIAADAALRLRLFQTSELTSAVDGLTRPRQARRVCELASSLSESAGESWCRLVFADLGLGQPRQQVEIRDERGRFVARVDFLFDDSRTVVEFDGEVKYIGDDGRERLLAEKRREDALRRLGYRVVRLGWRDLANPARVAELLRDVRWPAPAG